MKSRRKNRFRSTRKTGASVKTIYTDSPKRATNFARSGRTGTVSALNSKTNRFRKRKKYGW